MWTPLELSTVNDNTMKLLIAILAIIGSNLIGRYYKAVKAKELKSAMDASDYWQGKYNNLWHDKHSLSGKYQLAIKQKAEYKDRADQYYAELQSLKLKNDAATKS